MSNYSMSADASCKVKASDVKGYLKHVCRTDETKLSANLKEQWKHSNTNIDAERTHLNASFKYVDGEVVQIDQRQEDVLEMINKEKEKFNTYKEEYKSEHGQSVRKDAVQYRPFLLQLDSQFYEDNDYSKMSEDEQQAFAIKHVPDMVQSLPDRFKDNIIAIELHLDETNPHLHVVVETKDKEGSYTQGYLFPNVKQLKSDVSEIRNNMADVGYDIDVEANKTQGRKRLSENEYKDAVRGMKDEAMNEAREQARLEAGREINEYKREKLEEFRMALEVDKATAKQRVDDELSIEFSNKRRQLDDELETYRESERRRITSDEYAKAVQSIDIDVIRQQARSEALAKEEEILMRERSKAIAMVQDFNINESMMVIMLDDILNRGAYSQATRNLIMADVKQYVNKNNSGIAESIRSEMQNRAFDAYVINVKDSEGAIKLDDYGY